MLTTDSLRDTKLPLSGGSGAIPALGFGTLIPDPVVTRNATRTALEAGFRALDTAERYRTEKEVGEAMNEVFNAGEIKREDVFIATKLWNTNLRPDRVKPAFEASLKKLQLWTAHWTSISVTLLLPFKLETRRTRGMPRAM